MKILHSADWHLGKRLCGKPRLDEQSDVLDEIAAIADRENVDAVVVAGDIFDTSVPPAEAEELFFRACAKLCRNRCFIGIAGNHDDPERLAAPSGIAGALNIFLIGRNGKIIKSGQYETGENYVRIEKGGETLTIGVMPYPQHSALAVGDDREKPYAQLVKEKFDKISENFTKSDYNAIAAHVFAMRGESEEADDVLTDERTLGTASLLPVAVFPECDYTALGHVHKPMTVSKSKNILYSGSILSYSFDDASEKSVIVVEFSKENGKKKTDIKRVPLERGKRLVKLRAESFDEAVEALGKNSDKHVHLIYKGSTPLTLGEMNELKKYESLSSFQNAAEQKRETVVRKERPVKEQFEDFYKFVKKTDAAPPEDMVDMFLKVINGEEV